MSSLLLLFCLLLSACTAFAPAHPISRSESTTKIHLVGNFISGITGTPPSSLLPFSQKSSPLAQALTQGTSLQEKELACVYKASRDGWSAIDFHQGVDEKGSCLVVALARSGTVFGGFNPVGYRSTDDYYNSNAAFLFHVNGGDKVTKFPVLTGGNAAIFDYATGGPCFGSSDLIIGEPRAAVMGGFAGPDMEDTSLNAGDLRKGKSSGLLAYREDKRFPMRGEFQLTEVEVYCNAEFKDISPGGNTSWWPF